MMIGVANLMRGHRVAAPPAAITYVGGTTQLSSTSITLPAHQSGDLIILYAWRNGNNTPPTLPSGWTDIGGTGGSSNAARAGWLIATGSNTVSGTWSNATHMVALVYRGAAVGQAAFLNGSTTTTTYPALAPTGSSSWVVGLVGHRAPPESATAAPTGMTRRVWATSNAANSGSVAGHDTGAPVATWPQTSVATGANNGWCTFVVEITRP